jgi:hypothetical protein
LKVATKDYGTDIDSLKKIADLLGASTRSLDDFERATTRVFGRTFKRSVREAAQDLEEAVRRVRMDLEREVEKAGSAQALAAKKVGEKWGKSLIDGLLSTVSSRLSDGLPAVLKPLALIAGPLNQINKVNVEGYKIVSNVAAAYGQMLPSSIAKAQSALGNLDLTYTKIANRYGQLRDDIDATRTAILQNTIVQSRNIVEVEKSTERYTEQIAAMSKIHDIGMPGLTSQLIDQQKSLNESLETAAVRYSRVALYAREAGIGQQYLVRVSNDLAVSMKSSGAEFENVALFIATATKNLEKFGMSERVAMDAASSALRGISGIGMGGVSLLISQRVIPQLQRTLAEGGKLSAQAQSGILTAAASLVGPGGKAPTTPEEALALLSKTPGAGSLLMATTFNQSKEAFQAIQQTMNQLFPHGGVAQVYGAGIFGIRGPQEYLALQQALQGTRGFAETATAGADTKEILDRADNITKYLTDAKDIGRNQLTALEKIERYGAEIIRYQKIMAAAAVAGSVLTALGVITRIGKDYSGALDAIRKVLGGGVAGGAGGAGSGGGRLTPGTNTTVATPGYLGGLTTGAVVGIGAVNVVAGALRANENITAARAFGEAGISAGTALVMSGGNPYAAAVTFSTYEAGVALRLLVEMLRENRETDKALREAATNLATASATLRHFGREVPEDQRDVLAAVYGGIQARYSRGRSVPINYLMTTYGDMVGNDEKKMSYILQKLSETSSRDTKGKVATKIYDPVTGKQITIYVTDVGNQTASTNNVFPPTPTGSPSLVTQ